MTYSLTPSGGSFPLTSNLNLGTAFGVISPYFISSTALPATAGVLRLATTDSIEWRNFANSGNNVLTIDSSNNLVYNGLIVPTGLDSLADGQIWIGSVGNLPVAQTLTGDVTVSDTGVTAIGANKITNSQINSAAAIVYSKLNLTGSIVNNDIGSSASIAYSKLALSNSIVNADIASAAAIAYSKLALTGSILNSDLAGSIAYSKLILTGDIVNADIATTASIAFSKLAALNTSIVPVTNGSGVITSSAVTATTLGYLDATSSIQTQLNGKQATLTTGNLTEATSSVLTITGGTGAVIGSGTTIQVKQASGTVSGFLSSTDWSTFNSKLASWSGLTQYGAMYAGTTSTVVSTAAGTTGQFLGANTGAAPTWQTPTGSGTVNSGTAGQLAYYATSTNAVSGSSATISGSTITASLTGHASLDLALTGGTMSGAIAMGANKITGLANGTVATDAAAFGQVPVITAGQIVGTATNDNASAGNVGQYIVASGNIQPSGASGVWEDVVSIALTAGDWDVSGMWVVDGNSTVFSGALTQYGISTTSGNSSSGLNPGDNLGFMIMTSATHQNGGSIPAWRVSTAGTPTVYLKVFNSYSSGGPPQTYGRISARRVR